MIVFKGIHPELFRLSLLLASAVFLIALFPTAATAQPVVQSNHGAWQIQCDTPERSTLELCALVQNVFDPERPNVELRVTVVRTLDGGGHIFRVAAPLGVLLEAGMGLRVDTTDLGTADFVVCLPSGCYIEMIMDQRLTSALSGGETAWFLIYRAVDEGIGIPIDLAGFADGFAALE
ncbi:MAG: invasion associated locus B family protein [Pseudomonadota bacterium]